MVNKNNKLNWPEIARQVAAALPLSALHPAAIAHADTRPAKRHAVAFSGGADSLALLLLLWAHFPESRRHLVALHYNHRLRGRQSAADARFCQKICRALDIPIITGTWKNPPKNPAEADARDARLAFFSEQQKKLRAPILWQGHQLDDILETHLMRLTRGSGAAGLSAPRPVQKINNTLRLRPLLTLKKARLTAALRQAAAPWCEDATNAQNDYLRNRIRNQVIPALRQAAADRDLHAAAALTRELLDEDNAALDHLAAQLIPEYPRTEKHYPLNLRQVAAQPRAILRRLLHRWLQLTKTKPLSRPAFEQLLDSIAAATSTRHSLGPKTFALIRQKTLRLERTTFKKSPPRT